MPPAKQEKKDCRYHPFPLHPTFEQYKSQQPQWDALKDRLVQYQKSYKADEATNRIAAEIEEIKKERDAFIQTARNKSSWEKGTANDTFQHTLQCLADEECKEIEGYCVTIGRTNLFMCQTHFDTIDLDSDDLFLVNLHEKIPGMWDRAQFPDNWYKEEYEPESEHTSIKDILCSDTDECWYRGNTDRLSGYNYSYRLKGTKDIYVCDTCWDNCFGDFSVYMTQMIEDADVEIED